LRQTIFSPPPRVPLRRMVVSPILLWVKPCVLRIRVVLSTPISSCVCLSVRGPRRWWLVTIPLCHLVSIQRRTLWSTFLRVKPSVLRVVVLPIPIPPRGVVIVICLSLSIIRSTRSVILRISGIPSLIALMILI